ncbi:MAG TPA: dTDP-4-dehydrorhamnose reductase [Gammaproteobacteria bacterium]|nr:dTDP-4-dehydrorhamnose reductase [Gammaproteobacteria bacterium]
MKVLVTGAGGQVATALQKLKPAAIELISLGQAELDITDRDTVRRRVAILDPDVIINAAAYTAVDKAEGEKDLAERVNGAAPGYLAEAAYANGARLLHISTDFVFDGRADSPYKPDAVTAPLGAYGASKLEGEQRALEASRGQALVLRTAWVYAAKGHNFVLTMLRLMAERGTVKVVQDQRGSPTWADSVARALWAAADKPAFRGIHHWTDAGVTSWYDFARAIAEDGRAAGLLRREAEVLPITTAEYPTPARRPGYSVLDLTSTEAALRITAAPWRENLKKMLMELKHA